jgi:signal transduction histidine kinase
MMDIQEEARKKIARDLHDGPTQSIAAIAMRVNFARRLMERDFKAASEELYKIEELARRTTKEIRHMLFTLRPLVLESQGLVATSSRWLRK